MTIKEALDILTRALPDCGISIDLSVWSHAFDGKRHETEAHWRVWRVDLSKGFEAPTLREAVKDALTATVDTPTTGDLTAVQAEVGEDF